MGTKGKMRRVVKSLNVNNRSCISLEGKSSDHFPINQEFAQGCTFSPTLFMIYIHGLMCEIAKHPKSGVNFSKNKMSALLFADDFVGIAETGSPLQIIIEISYIIIANIKNLKPM